jgi:low temperature requirement protein LtrA
MTLTADSLPMPEYAHRREGERTSGGHRMSTVGDARTGTESGDSFEQRVTPLELFFDLVFVFALTQVTGFLTDHLTWIGMSQGAAILAALW